ncbi:MAG: hypothetical protein ACSLEN_12215 [Candidatus Malihini olakiniferum]
MLAALEVVQRDYESKAHAELACALD